MQGAFWVAGELFRTETGSGAFEPWKARKRDSSVGSIFLSADSSDGVVWVYLEPVHLPAAHVVIHRASEDVHGVVDHGRRVEQPAARHLRTQPNGGPPSGNETQ